MPVKMAVPPIAVVPVPSDTLILQRLKILVKIIRKNVLQQKEKEKKPYESKRKRDLNRFAKISNVKSMARMLR